MPTLILMVLLACIQSSSRRTSVVAFRPRNIPGRSKQTTRLHQANFFENLQRSFSQTAAGTMGDDNKATYTVGITGANGLVGSALRNELATASPTVNGKPVRVVSLTRSTTAAPLEDSDTSSSVSWNPSAADPTEIVHPSVVSELDAIVHLSGENVSTGQGPLGFLGIRPWTDSKKKEILRSRVKLTTALSNVVAASEKRITLLTASGVGAYGDDFIDDSKEAVDESYDISQTKGFLADVSRAWEAATETASKKQGSQVVNMRFGVVMSTKGGALGKLYPIFMLGGGGNVGSGQQYFSFISARDIARAIVHTLQTPSLRGPVNLCAPNPCTNAEFTQALGSNINRPTVIPLPSFAVSLLFGEMGEEMLLGGVRCIPTKLTRSGFEFLHPTIDQAIKSALEEDI